MESWIGEYPPEEIDERCDRLFQVAVARLERWCTCWTASEMESKGPSPYNCSESEEEEESRDSAGGESLVFADSPGGGRRR